MSKYTKQDFEEMLQTRSEPVVDLFSQVIEFPNNWNKEKFISEFRKLPRNGANAKKRNQSRSVHTATHNWNMIKDHGFLLEN